jgi:hypothetical protein
VAGALVAVDTIRAYAPRAIVLVTLGGDGVVRPLPGAARCTCGSRLMRIPAMPIANSELMAITIPKDADRRRSEATLGCSYHAEVIGIRQSLCA